MNSIKEHYRHWLPKMLKVDGVTYGTSIYYRQGQPYVSARLRRHEEEHVLQYLKYGKTRFLIQYMIEYCIGRLKGLEHQKAYENISFEVQARKAERT